ncbi:MAG: MarR family transcriptional regulator [Acidobacteriota bacterium]
MTSLHTLYFVVDRAAHGLRKRADPVLSAAAGLTTAQAAALRIVVDEGGATPGQIAQRLGHRESAATTMVRRLESAGFVRRTPSKHDRRSVVLRATPTGKRALGRLLGAFEELDARVAEVLSKEEQEAMTSGLLRLLEVLHEPRESKER